MTDFLRPPTPTLLHPAGHPFAGPAVDPHWYAVFTNSNHEKRVAEHFAHRQIESFLPLYQAIHRWKNRCTVTLDLPLFPNYIFVRMGRCERVRVLEVPGVVSVVGCGREPVPLPDFDIDSLRAGLRGRKFEPHPYLVVGDRARIKAGALAGMEGVVVRKKTNLRIVLTVAMIMQSVAVEVEADDLEPVHHCVPPFGNA